MKSLGRWWHSKGPPHAYGTATSHELQQLHPLAHWLGLAAFLDFECLDPNQKELALEVFSARS